MADKSANLLDTYLKNTEKPDDAVAEMLLTAGLDETKLARKTKKTYDLMIENV